jgi:hypothetical protein
LKRIEEQKVLLIIVIMTNSQSKPTTAKIAERIEAQVKYCPPPIGFTKSAKAAAKKESLDYREFQMYLDKKNDKSGKTTQSVPIFENGDPEAWCDWRRHMEDLFASMELNEDHTDKKIQLITSVLRGKALDSFRTYQAAQEEANDKRKEPWDEDDVLEHILNDMALGIFSNRHSYHHQVFFMKYGIFMGEGTMVKEFEKRVTWLNQCFKYFPMVKMRNGQFKKCKPLDEDELRDIYTLAIKPAWATKIMESNSEPNDLSLAELIDYLEKLEQVDKLKKSVNADKEGKPHEGKRKRSKEIRGNAKKKQRTDSKEDVEACDTCGKCHCGECWHKNKNNKQGNNKFCPGSAGKSSQKTYTMEEIKELTQFSYAMFGNLDASKKSSKKKHKSDNDERDGEINHMLAKMRIEYA